MALLGTWGDKSNVPLVTAKVLVPSDRGVVTVIKKFNIDPASTYSFIPLDILLTTGVKVRRRKFLCLGWNEYPKNNPSLSKHLTVQTMAGPVCTWRVPNCSITLARAPDEQEGDCRIDLGKHEIHFFKRQLFLRLMDCLPRFIQWILRYKGRGDMSDAFILGIDVLKDCGIVLVHGADNGNRKPMIIAPGSGEEINEVLRLHAELKSPGN